MLDPLPPGVRGLSVANGLDPRSTSCRLVSTSEPTGRGTIWERLSLTGYPQLVPRFGPPWLVSASTDPAGAPFSSRGVLVRRFEGVHLLDHPLILLRGEHLPFLCRHLKPPGESGVWRGRQCFSSASLMTDYHYPYRVTTTSIRQLVPIQIGIQAIGPGLQKIACSAFTRQRSQVRTL